MTYDFQNIVKQLDKKYYDYLTNDDELISLVKDQKLDVEEIEMMIEDEWDTREIKPITSERKKELQQIATHTLKELEKKKQISLRIYQRDIPLIKSKALELGLPYQTLITALIHQYAHGKIEMKMG